MAKAFQEMLERFGLEQKVLVVTMDNATSNDTQTAKLSKLNNSFSTFNRVRCFNHTLQLCVCPWTSFKNIYASLLKRRRTR
ncbi:hypothetical protein SERLA73DRAFT_138494 [Serpula lacrymans var. lacrymans S7.3]|uniref:DUF659 domain-containing protein n=1 Tax=Serpula lacrymans var. lacrymans (strain S7.3) TaxID=936435 RepID=F8Q1K0_SERL3|nr:hypothetical protein SERLA73DRAFT_138494 [Serpula lacrymans var. lacrymans S7.3]